MVTDAAVSTFIRFLTEFSHQGEWSVCRFLVAEVLALEICSSYHLVAITVNRYIAIVYPLRYHEYVTNKSTAATVVSIWIFSQGSAILIYTIYNPDVKIPANCVNRFDYKQFSELNHLNVLNK
ncbi:hypothetical protein KUTeg_007507 [Tegillarca granosa]|uniref:G-protein coupled receptors family 1 profile domain-containing protein n=1 Tax=Tegillarca granosa TaxID=220873 RepID=A0ABQ9FHH6_TEGGR|nr:hypothetical protein KUTeg_007507 [Tegillarca granosa]